MDRTNEQAAQEMDFAAMDAGAELDSKFDPVAVQQFAAWWKKHYLRAGHKRLAWQLMQRLKS